MIQETETRESPRPYGFKRLLCAVKEAVRVETLADALGAELRKTGTDMRGLCPIHGGQNRDALSVRPDTGRWHCFRCDEGGDVLDLFQRARNYFDPKLALMDLAGEYGVQVPARPERWHRWQTEKDRRRAAIRDVRARLYQRRLFRMLAADLERIADPDEREAEARQIFADLSPLARACAEWKAGE